MRFQGWLPHNRENVAAIVIRRVNENKLLARASPRVSRCRREETLNDDYDDDCPPCEHRADARYPSRSIDDDASGINPRSLFSIYRVRRT